MKVEIYVDSMLVATCGNPDLAVTIAKDVWERLACDIEIWEWPGTPITGPGHAGRGPDRIWKRFQNGTEVDVINFSGLERDPDSGNEVTE